LVAGGAEPILPPREIHWFSIPC